MPSILRVCFSGVSIVASMLATTAAISQQVDIRQALSLTIQQLQTGQLSPNWYSPQLWQTIAAQTGNTGVYTALRDLGPVTNMVINQQMQLPLGPIYSITAQHKNGVSYWWIGVNTFASRLEYANFNVNSSSGPLPGAPAAASPNPPANPPPPSSSSAACSKFPDLC